MSRKNFLFYCTMICAYAILASSGLCWWFSQACGYSVGFPPALCAWRKRVKRFPATLFLFALIFCVDLGISFGITLRFRYTKFDCFTSQKLRYVELN